MSGLLESLKRKLGIIKRDPRDIPPVGAVLMITNELKFLVKSHLRRNRLIIQKIRAPEKT